MMINCPLVSRKKKIVFLRGKIVFSYYERKMTEYKTLKLFQIIKKNTTKNPQLLLVANNFYHWELRKKGCIKRLSSSKLSFQGPKLGCEGKGWEFFCLVANKLQAQMVLKARAEFHSLPWLCTLYSSASALLSDRFHLRVYTHQMTKPQRKILLFII